MLRGLTNHQVKRPEETFSALLPPKGHHGHSPALLYLVLTARADRQKHQIVALGLLGYLFYAYAIYVIERAYNGLYLVYMAIFTLATGHWIMPEPTSAGTCPNLPSRKTLRRVSASGASLQPLIFYPLWIGMLLALMQSG